MFLEKYAHKILATEPLQSLGVVTEVKGLLVKGYLPGAMVGSVCQIQTASAEASVMAEVVGFSGPEALMMPLTETRGVAFGQKIILKNVEATVRVGPGLLGRVINGYGDHIDAGSDISASDELPIYRSHVNPMDREPITDPFDVGIRSINGLISMGVGQRISIMAGSGVGKSVLMGMIARNAQADINVIALIGERGREVREFIERDLGVEGMKKSVVIVVTSDESPVLRMRGAFLATTVAEYFASQGLRVMLMMDSMTRFAMAQREVGLSIGEPPATKGYTPSVFALLPKILERAGRFKAGGSITAIYTVLVEGEDMDDPIGDAVRSIVDGHIVLKRRLAEQAHFPAIDVLASISRVMSTVVPPEHLRMAQQFRELMATYKEAEDLIMIGAYKTGLNPQVDRAVKLGEAMKIFLRQRVEERGDLVQTCRALQQILV